MNCCVTADAHGRYAPLRDPLSKAGFFDDADADKLTILGDLPDRGR